MAMARLRLPNLGPRATSGSAAVEFAMIAPVFLLLLFAIMEVALSFYADQILANAVIETGRLIRTGQAQQQNMSASQFRTALCNKINYLLSCDSSKLYVDVRSFSSFGTAAYPQALDAAGNLNPSLNSYQPGGSSDTAGVNTIVLIRAFYKWKLLTPMVSAHFANMSGSTRLLSASVAFRNEPY